MNIAFLHPTYPGGEGTGTSYTATQLVSGLVERENDVTVYCRESPAADAIHADNLSYEVVQQRHSLEHPTISPNRALRGRVDEFDQYDLVHSYPMFFLPAMATIGEQTSASTVVTLNGYRPVCPKNDLRYKDEEPCRNNGLLRCSSCIFDSSLKDYKDDKLRSLLGRFGNFKLLHETRNGWDSIDQFHAQAPHVGSIFGKFGLDESSISVVPNILDERFQVEHESDFSEPYRLLYIGDLHRRKGVMKIPRIAAALRDAAFEFEFTVVGDGEMSESLSRKVDEEDISEFVNLVGRVPYEELPGIYATHDLFVYPGDWDEPFARVFLEAMGTGTPVVASDVGDVSDILGGAGAVSGGNPGEIAASIRRAVENDRLAKMSTEGQNQVERYTPNRILPELLEMYNDVLGE